MIRSVVSCRLNIVSNAQSGFGFGMDDNVINDVKPKCMPKHSDRNWGPLPCINISQVLGCSLTSHLLPDSQLIQIFNTIDIFLHLPSAR